MCCLHLTGGLYALERMISWKTSLIKRSLLSILTKHTASSDETGTKGSFIFILDMQWKLPGILPRSCREEVGAVSVVPTLL